eukprot:gene21576-27614_t
MFFYVRLSYVELYNNTFRNLLADVSKSQHESDNKRIISRNPNINLSSFFNSQDDSETSLFDTSFGPSFASARANSTQLGIKQPPGYAQRQEKIEVREDKNHGVYLSGQHLRIAVTSSVEAYQLVSKGNKVRVVGSTNCNDVSSRSHAVLTFHVESHRTNATGGEGVGKNGFQIGKLHLVDLAGSERLSQSEAEGVRMLETQNINSSLSALGDVLSALASNAEAVMKYSTHSRSTTPSKRGPPTLAPVPYRNSKLTHLLKDSLGGNSKTVMITNVRTSSEYFSQTQVSLDWSARARTIRNKSLVNRNVVGDTGIMSVNSEIERLMKRIDERTVEFEKLKMQQMAEKKENIGLKNRLKELQLTNDQERQQLESQVSQVIHSQAGHIQSQRTKISLLQTALQDELTMSQNVIAEQEKEIRWLQEELEKTAATAVDNDRLANMKRVSDHWENQAKTHHQELSKVLQQAEELKNINVEMMSRTHELERVHQEAQDEANHRLEENVELGNMLTQLRMEKQEMEKTVSDSKSELKGTLKTWVEREKELLQRVASLEEEVRHVRNSHDNEKLQGQQYTTQLQKKMNEMEKDKVELASRLTTTIGAIEKKTTQVVEDANQKIAHKEMLLKDAEIQSQMMNEDIDKLKSMLTELQDTYDFKMQSKDQSIVELETALNKELQFSSQQEAKLLSMEGLQEGFRDKMTKQKAKIKELETAAAVNLERYTTERAELVAQVSHAKASKEREREALMNEFERILQAKKEDFHAELEGAVNDWNDMKEATEAAHQQEMDAMQADFQRKEQQFQAKLVETDQKYKALIESEIGASIRQLETQHKAAVEKLRADHAKQLGDALQKQQSIFDSVLSERLEQLGAECEESKQTALSALEEQLLERLEKFTSQIESKHADQVAALEESHAQLLEESLRRQQRDLEASLAKKTRELAGSAEQERSELVERLQEDHEQALSELRVALEEDSIRSLQRLRANAEEEKAELLRDVQEKHRVETLALRTEFENEMLRNVEDVLTKAERERKTVLAEQQKKRTDEFEVIETKYQRQIDELQSLVKQQRVEFELSHENKIDELTSSHRDYQMQMDRKVAQFKASSEERAETAIAEHSQRVEDDYRRKVDELTRREKDMSRQYADTIQSVEDKYNVDIASALLKERVRLNEKHEQEVSSLKADLLASQQRALSAADSKSQELVRESVEVERAQLNEQFQRKLLATEKDFRQLLADSIAAQKEELEANFSSDMQILRNKLSSEQLKSESELRSTHTLEIDNLVARHRREVEELRRELESGLQSSQDEKDREIAALRSDLVALGVRSRDELSSAIETHRQELVDRLRVEQERHRADKHEAESRHQEEMSVALASHLVEIAKQRKQLDASHNRLVDSLHEELASAKERCSQALSLMAAKEGEGSQTALDLKLKHDEQLRALVRDRDAQHRAEMESLEQTHEDETQKLRVTVDKLRAKLAEELQSRDSEHEEELERQLGSLRERAAKESAEIRRGYEDALAVQLNDLTSRNKIECDKLREDMRVLDMKCNATVAESENRVLELTEKSLVQTMQFEAEKVRIFEDTKQKIARIESRYHNETSTLETSQQELESRLKAKFREQMQQLKDETDAELLRQSDEAKAILIKRDEHYQREIILLKSTISRNEAEFRNQSEVSDEVVADLKRRNNSLLDAMNELQSQFAEEKTNLLAAQDDALRAVALQQKTELQRVTAELSDRHMGETDRLEAALESAKKEFRAQQQQSLNQALLSKEQLQEAHQNQISEVQDLLAAERLKVTQLKLSHAQEVDSLRRQLEEEKSELLAAKEDAVRHTMQQGDAEVNRVMAELRERHAQELMDSQDRLEGERYALQQQIVSLTAQHRAALKEVEDELRDQVEGLTFDVEKERGISRRLKDVHSAQIRDLENQFDVERSALKASHEETTRSESARRDQELRRVRDSHAADMEDIQQRFDAEAQFLRDRLHAVDQDAQNKVKGVEMEGREQISVLAAQLDKEKAALAQLEEKHRQAVAAKEEAFQEELRAVSAEHTESLHELRVEMELLRVQHSREMQEQLVAQEDLLSEQHQALYNNLSGDLQSAKAANDRAARDLEHQLADAKSAVEDMRKEYEHKVSLHADEMTHLREKAARDLEAERLRLTDHFNGTIRLNSDSAQREISLHEEELQAIHTRELELSKAQNKAELSALRAANEREIQELLNSLKEEQDGSKSLKRQIAKTDALRDSLQQELDNMRAERHSMLDSMNKLELEIIEHGQAKFEARLSSERDKIDQSYKEAFSEVRAEVAQRVDENKALLAKLGLSDVEVASMRAVAKFAEEERERLEVMFKSILSERDAAHEGEMRRSLEAQHEELQGGYLKLVQQQVDSLMVLIQKQNTQHSSSQQVDDLQNRFMSLVQDLPDLWKQKHGSFPGGAVAPSTPERSTSRAPNSPAKTPLYLLAGGSHSYDLHDNDNHDFELNKKNRGMNGKQVLPWSSPSLRSSPTDQLIAAILDGDVQGIRAVVRSKGEDLSAEFWKDLSKTVLPLHRAVSGLHFHGSEKLLVNTIETLSQLGADVNAADHAGNTVLHKAIQVCTSKSIAAVVQTLLTRGSNPSTRNKDGDSPLHSECKRVRTASVDVIEALIAAGADPNSKNQHNSSITPLTLVLLRGASSTVTGAGLIGQGEESAFGISSVLSGRGLDVSFDVTGDGDHDSVVSSHARKNGHSLINGSNGHGHGATQHVNESDVEKAHVAGRRVWIKAAEMLVKSGAHWDSAWRTPRGCSQLHLFLAAFPPTREDSSMYRALLKSALEHGVNPAVEDDRGRNALFVLCEQMCLIASDVSPDAARLMHIVLDACGASGVGGSDRTGRTVFDIEERVPHSCLSACRQILLDSANHHRVIPLRHSKPPAQVHYPSGGRSIGSASSVTSDWELEKPKPPSASQVASRYAVADAKRKISSGSHVSLSDNASYSARSGVAQQFHHESSLNSSRDDHSLQYRHSTSVQDQHRKRPASASSQTSSYFEDDDDEISVVSGGYGRSGGSLRGNGGVSHHQHH